MISETRRVVFMFVTLIDFINLNYVNTFSQFNYKRCSVQRLHVISEYLILRKIIAVFMFLLDLIILKLFQPKF